MDATIHMQSGRTEGRRSNAGFTIVELLVVIAIITLLAGLMVGLGGPAMRKYKEARVRTELHELETVIEDYKERLGFYPPDNGDPVQKPDVNQLFYELTGAAYDENNKTFKTINGITISQPNVVSVFNRGGIANSMRPRNFYRNIRPRQYATNSSGVIVLVVPVETAPGQINPWRYNSSNPTHNPNSFDLWAEINIGGTTKTIGNWKD
jgi:prepilin-type N-terminal cleavage/methylation domain-containing protein